jgi:hypothetical protein
MIGQALELGDHKFGKADGKLSNYESGNNKSNKKGRRETLR